MFELLGKVSDVVYHTIARYVVERQRLVAWYRQGADVQIAARTCLI